MSDIITRPIGDIFEYRDKKYQVCKELGPHSCCDCAFCNKFDCYSFRNIRGYCDGSRTDKQGVIFKEIKAMRKEDIVSGMIVEYRNGSRRLVIRTPNEIYLVGSDSSAYLRFEENYNEDLTFHSSSSSNLDISKVYKVINPQLGLNHFFDSPNLKLLWEREKPKTELTLEQIAEKFNIPVESLRIKD